MRDVQLKFYLDTINLYKRKNVPSIYSNQLHEMIFKEVLLCCKEDLTLDHLKLIQISEFHFASIDEFKKAEVLKNIIDNKKPF